MAGFSLDSTDPETTTFTDDLRALARCPRELWLVYLATCFEYVGVFSFLMTLSLWLSSDFGMTDSQAGWWASTFSTLLTALVFVAGPIADALGVRTTLILAFSLAAVTRLGMSLAPTSAIAIAALLAFAFAFASGTPALQVAVQRASTARTRAFAFSLWYVSVNVGGVVSGVMFDATRAAFLDPVTHELAPRAITLPLLGAHRMTANAAILGIGFLSASLAALVVMLMRRDFEHREDSSETSASRKASPIEVMREVLGDGAFWRFMVMLALLSLVRMMLQHLNFTWPKYVIREQGEAFPVGLVWGLNSLLILGLAPLGTALTRRRRPLDVLLFGALLTSLSPFILCFGSSMLFQLAMVVTLTVGEALWSPRLYEYNVTIAPRGRESTYVSLAALPYFLAKLLVGPTSGYLLTAYCPAHGPRRTAMVWSIIGAATMIGPIGIWLGRGWFERKDETACPG